MLSGNSLRQSVHTHRASVHHVHTHHASVHQAAKLVAALLRVARLAESNGSLPLGLWLTSPPGWLSRTGISSGTLSSLIECGLPFLICQSPHCLLYLLQTAVYKVATAWVWWCRPTFRRLYHNDDRSVQQRKVHSFFIYTVSSLINY